MSLIDLVQQNLGPDGVQDISRQLGTDPATTQRAIDAALPMMVGGMAHAAQQPGGETAVQAALGAHGAGGLGGALGGLGGLGGMLGGGGGGGILGSILGGHHDTVQDGVSQASGLDSGKVTQLLILLAPIVLRALSKHQASSHPGGLGAGLQEEAQSAQANAPSPHVGGILGKILGGLGG
jgi:hypothetical protein